MLGNVGLNCQCNIKIKIASLLRNFIPIGIGRVGAVRKVLNATTYGEVEMADAKGVVGVDVEDGIGWCRLFAKATAVVYLTGVGQEVGLGSEASPLTREYGLQGQGGDEGKVEGAVATEGVGQTEVTSKPWSHLPTCGERCVENANVGLVLVDLDALGTHGHGTQSAVG